MIRSRFLALLVVAAAAAVVATGCGGSGSKSLPADVVARVKDKDIAKSQFDALIRQAERSYKARKQEFPKAGTPEYQQLVAQAMQFLVQRCQFAQKAEELGIKVSAKEVEDRLAKIKKQYFGGNEKRYRDALKQQGLTDKQVREDIRAQLISEKIFNKVTASVEVTDRDVRDYYDKHPEQYSQPASRDVRHILVGPKKKALADRLYKQLTEDKADFAQLARRYSEDPGSKTQGGKLTVSQGQTVPPFDKVAFSLKRNEISKPVKTTYGWHIIQALSAVRPRKVTPFDQVKEAIKQQLLSTKRSEAMRKWLDDLKKEYEDAVTYQKGYEPPPTTSTGTTTATTAG